MKTDLLRGTRERMRTGIIDKVVSSEHRISELERANTTGSVQVERQIISAAGGGGGGTTPLAYATTAEIADIATSEAAGTSTLVARGDHVHAHPAIGSGDLHTQYILADGTRSLTGNWSAGDSRQIQVGRLRGPSAGDTPNGTGWFLWFDEVLTASDDPARLYSRVTNQNISHVGLGGITTVSDGINLSGRALGVHASFGFFTSGSETGILSSTGDYRAAVYAAEAFGPGSDTWTGEFAFYTTLGFGLGSYGPHTLYGFAATTLGLGMLGIVTQVAFKAGNLTEATNNWGLQIGTANSGSYLNHNLSLGAASAATSAWLHIQGTDTVNATTQRRSYYDTSDITITLDRTAAYYLNHIEPNIDVSATKTASGQVALLTLAGSIASDLTGTLGNFYSLLIQPSYMAMAGTVTKWTALRIISALLGNASTEIGIHNDLTSRLVGAVTVGADAAVTSGLILDITGNAGIKNEGELRLYDSGSSNYIGIRSNNARTTDLVYVLPVTDPTAGQILSASAPVAGVVTLSWAADATGAGAVATDTIWDAKGDLAVGTGANTAVAVTVGANDTILMADSTQAAGVKWVASAAPVAVGTANSEGTSDDYSRASHVHAHEAAHINHDTTWAAKGDLIVATANDTAQVLTVGSNNKVVIAASGETTGLKYDYVYHEVTVTVENPTASENIVVRQFTQAVTIDVIQAVVIGGTSVTIDPEHGSTITTATKLLSAAEVVASASTTGEHIGGTGTAMAASFNDNTLAAGDFLRLETTAISGTPTQLSVTFRYRLT